MLPGVYLLGNFWSSVFQTMQPQAGLQVVAILYIEIVFASMGNLFMSQFHAYLSNYILFLCGEHY
jgi:hypothetical protein